MAKVTFGKSAIKNLAGSANSVVAVWTFSLASKTKEYTVRWDYYNGDTNKWIYESPTTVKSKQSTYTIPQDVYVTKVRVSVTPRAKTKKGFKEEVRTSGEFAGGNVAVAKKNIETARKNAKNADAAAAANVKTANGLGSSYDEKVRKAGLYSKAATQYGTAADWWEKAGDSAKQSVSENNKTLNERRAETVETNLYELCVANAKDVIGKTKSEWMPVGSLDEAKAFVERGKRMNPPVERGYSKHAGVWGVYTVLRPSCADVVAEAKTLFNSGNYANAAKKYTNAAKRYDKASDWWRKAADAAQNEGDRKVCQDKADEKSDYAKKCEDKADDATQKAEKAKQTKDAQNAKPDNISSLEVTQTSIKTDYILRNNLFHIEWVKPVGYATITEVQVRTDYGSWTALQAITSKENPTLEVFQKAKDFTGSSGHTYEFRVRLGLSNKKTYSDWVYSSAFSTTPERGDRFHAKIAEDGQSVRLRWIPDAKTLASVESFEVQYSNFYTDNNAWMVGAYDTITSLDAKMGRVVKVEEGGKEIFYREYTVDVSEWDEGNWYFRVYAKNSAGYSEPMLLKVGGEEGKVTETVVVKKKAPKLNQPTSLTPALVEGQTGKVKLTWTDKLEYGAWYEIDHSPNTRAFIDNAQGDITTDKWENPGDADISTTRTFTVVNLNPGQHVFRVRKVNDKGEIKATSASGNFRLDDYTVTLDVPPAGSAVLTPRPTNLTCEKTTYEGGIKVLWDGSATGEEKFEIQYTDNAYAYQDNAIGDIKTATYDELPSGATSFLYTLTELDLGRTWHIRVRKTSDAGRSLWATLASSHEEGVYPSETENVVSVDLAPAQEELDKLTAPTTSATDMSYQVGDQVIMSWIHNSEDNTDQTAYQVEITVTPQNEPPSVQVLEGTTDNAVTFDTTGYPDGTQVEWRVRTQGAYEGYYSPWSQTRMFGIFVPPVVSLSLADGTGQDVVDQGLSTLPLKITVNASSAAANPITEVGVSIASASSHTAVGDDGGEAYIAKDQEVYSRYLTASDFEDGTAMLEVSAAETMLDSGYQYYARATVFTQMGLSATSEDSTFDVQWAGFMADPEATVEFDSVNYTCTIYPVCYETDPEGMVPEEPSTVIPEEDLNYRDEGDDTPTEGESAGESADEPTTEEPAADEPSSEEPVTGDSSDDEEFVEEEMTEEEEALIILIDAEEDIADDTPEPNFATGETDEEQEEFEYRQNTTLDVYRVNYDGSTTPIQTGLRNDGYASCTDPHPTFGTCTYRIVAHDTLTDTQTATEVTVSTPAKRVVITWDEVWTSSNDTEEDDIGGYAGSMAVLPFNVELQEQHSADRVVNNFIGRRLGVAYYGERVSTQATFKADIRKTVDDSTRDALRRLGSYPGICYVRDRTGLGFWATADVDISHTYESPKVAVSLNFERVEGPGGENA